MIVSIEDLGEEFGEYTWEPSNAIEVGDTSMLRFGSEEDAFQLALQVSVEEAGPNRLRIETRPMFRQGASKRWDFFRPKETAQALVALQQQQITLDARMQAIQRQFRRDPAARDQATAIHNQQSALLLENIATLERMSDRCLELQDKGQLHFRVYAESAAGQIDLVRTKTESLATDGDENKEPDGPGDPNIGAPIDPNDAAPASDPDADNGIGAQDAGLDNP